MYVTTANPTSLAYWSRGFSREEHVAIKDKEKLKNVICNRSRISSGNIKDKEKLKNGKYFQRCQLIDSDFIPVAFEIYNDGNLL